MPDERLPVFATRMNYKMVEARLKGAKTGFELLKTKSGALKIHYKKMQDEFNSTNENIEVLFQKAFLSLSRAEFYGANVKVFKKKCSKANVQVETTVDQVCGLLLPRFKLIRSNVPMEDMLSKGGHKLMEAKNQFDQLLNLLIEISSIKNSFEMLKEALDATNRRVNTLDHIIIPRLKNTLQFISGELDEQERESFYKLKKIQRLNKSS